MKRILTKNWLIGSLSMAMIAVAASSCGGSVGEEEEAQQPANAPGDNNFAALINSVREGKVNPQPWAGYWWPLNANGVASGKTGSGKSPAGKFDAAHGNKTHSQAWEVENHGTGQKRPIQGWEGHCNGWSVAAALYAEPHSSVKSNGVEFSVSDIKALLTEAGMNASADYFGEAMNDSNYASPAYRDTVPGQAFLVLTNYIGRRGQAVLIDRVTDYEKWNQPLAGYRFEYPKKSDYIGATAEAPNVYRIKVQGTIWWMNDNVMGDEPSPVFNYEDTPDQVIMSRVLTMELWLDGPVVFDDAGKIVSSGNIVVTRDPANPKYFVGGTWLMDGGMDGWPDYMWVPFSILPPNPENANPEIDIHWLEQHLLVPGGADDPAYGGAPIDNAPPVQPSHSPSPSSSPHQPDPQPMPPPGPQPQPQPVPTGPGPIPQPPTPAPQPTGPGPQPPTPPSPPPH